MPTDKPKTIDLLVGKFYRCKEIAEAGFTYLPLSSTPQWKVYGKDNIRIHLNYGEYRFAYIPQEHGIGQIVGSFGVL